MQALNVKFNLKDNSKRKKFLVGSDLKNIKKLSLDKKLKKILKNKNFFNLRLKYLSNRKKRPMFCFW